MNVLKAIQYIGVAFCMIGFIGGCAVTRQTPVTFAHLDTGNLPPVAAEFETEIHKRDGHAHDSLHRWRLLRQAERVEIHDSSANMSDIWSRTSNDLLFYERVFHEDRHVVEYSPVDLNVLGVERRWDKLVLAFDPEILRELGTGRPAGTVAGYEGVRYKGTVDAVGYEVVWLPQIKLPALIRQTRDDGEVVTRLRTLHAMEQSPWPPTDTAQYRIVEYSDMGDLERDPFVMKVLNQIPGGHSHGH